MKLNSSEYLSLLTMISENTTQILSEQSKKGTIRYVLVYIYDGKENQKYFSLRKDFNLKPVWMSYELGRAIKTDVLLIN
jgi:hypothetical protein